VYDYFLVAVTNFAADGSSPSGLSADQPGVPAGAANRAFLGWVVVSC